ncbi:MAG: hypothetical protein HPY71_14540 [Firmicutes bacterium]|nr:hypothetical protein [Bacillota bacterium]
MKPDVVRLGRMSALIREGPTEGERLSSESAHRSSGSAYRSSGGFMEGGFGL